MSWDKPNAEVDLPWSQPKEDFRKMCLNKSLLLFLACVKGKTYFTPKRKIWSCLLKSPVNQEAWRLLAFILFAKLKADLGFLWVCACAKQQNQCWMWAIRRRALWGDRLTLTEVPKWVACPGASVPLQHAHHGTAFICRWSHWLQQGSTSTYKPRTYLAQQQLSKYSDIKSVPR